MLKKFFTYQVFLILVVSFIVIILFGALLRHHYLGGERFKPLQKVAVTLASVPKNLKKMIKLRTINLNKIQTLQKHKNKDKFFRFIKKKRNALLIIPRYIISESRSVVDVIDMDTFEVIHTYKHNISEMNKKVNNNNEFPRLNIDHSPTRFQYRHPLILEDGSLISVYGPIYKLDFCSNLVWINDEDHFHHSKMLDHDGNIWVGGQLRPHSKFIRKYNIKNYMDDSIVKLNSDGKILFNKSVTEILIENNILFENFALTSSLKNVIDPIHLNDIEPVFEDSKYWKKGDLFLSLRDLSAIVQYRPNLNKVRRYITGPFSMQHDVDIISDKEISIFNNNNFYADNQNSEVLIFNFETEKFSKLFNQQLQSENFKTFTAGLSHIFEDGSLMVDESNHSRIILFGNDGNKEWEFVNKDKNDDIGFMHWSRVIEDQKFIDNYKYKIENTKCLN